MWFDSDDGSAPRLLAARAARQPAPGAEPPAAAVPGLVQALPPQAADARPFRPAPWRPALDGHALRVFPVSEDVDAAGAWRGDPSLPARRPAPWRPPAVGADAFPTPGVEVLIQALAAPPPSPAARRAFAPSPGAEPAWGRLPPRQDGWDVPALFVRPRPAWRPAAPAPADVPPPPTPDPALWGWRVDAAPAILPARTKRAPEGAAPPPGAGVLIDGLALPQAGEARPARPPARPAAAGAEPPAAQLLPPPGLPPSGEGLPGRPRAFRPGDVTDTAPPALLESQLGASYFAALAPLRPAAEARRPAPAPFRAGEGASALELSLTATAYLLPQPAEGLPARARAWRPAWGELAAPPWGGAISIAVAGPYYVAAALVYSAYAAAGDVQGAN